MAPPILQPFDVPGARAAVVWAHAPAFWRPRHHHSELEFNLVHRGTARFAVGSRTIVANPGTLVWLLPGVDHELISCSSDFDMWVAGFKPALVERVLGGTSAARPRRFIDGDSVHLTGADFSVVHALCRVGFGCAPADSSGALGTLLARMLQVSHGQRRSLGARVAELLQASPELTRRDIGRRLGVSESSLSPAFNGRYGMSIPEYRARVRLQRALALVEAGERSLLRAALEAGFGSYAQFHRAVRTMTSLAPRALLSTEQREALRARVSALAASAEVRSLDDCGGA